MMWRERNIECVCVCMLICVCVSICKSVCVYVCLNLHSPLHWCLLMCTYHQSQEWVTSHTSMCLVHELHAWSSSLYSPVWQDPVCTLMPVQQTPASSEWPQLWLPHPFDPHSVRDSSDPVHATLSIQILPLPPPKVSTPVPPEQANSAQTTFASVLSQLSSHTVPHSPALNTSTRQQLSLDQHATSRTFDINGVSVGSMLSVNSLPAVYVTSMICLSRYLLKHLRT